MWPLLFAVWNIDRAIQHNDMAGVSCVRAG
jgi:hypothetical protein